MMKSQPTVRRMTAERRKGAGAIIRVALLFGAPLVPISAAAAAVAEPLCPFTGISENGRCDLSLDKGVIGDLDPDVDAGWDGTGGGHDVFDNTPSDSGGAAHTVGTNGANESGDSGDGGGSGGSGGSGTTAGK